VKNKYLLIDSLHVYIDGFSAEIGSVYYKLSGEKTTTRGRLRISENCTEVKGNFECGCQITFP
jgi:hypothetical protein